MAPPFCLDLFNLCWNQILMESKEMNNTFFNETHCIVEETRDIDFDKVENRLAYMYKFGSFNIQFVEKCITDFLEECSEAKNLFSKESLKIGSLSNGPGLDLIGLLCALYKSSESLKCFPTFKAINLYDSWSSIFNRIVSTVYDVTSSSFYDHFNIPPANIHLIQSDLYSTLSSEAEACIRESDVLLMLKTFSSSKATPDIVMKSLQEIFSLLNPGSFVFFIGSKRNKELTSNNALNKIANCVYGPKKITFKNLSVNENIVKAVGVKPKESGHAYFIVWQKRDTDVPQKIIVKKKKRAKRKNKSNLELIQKKIINDSEREYKDNTDAGSEISFTSWSKKSETSDEFKTSSQENTFQSDASIKISAKNSVGKDENSSEKDSTSSITSLLEEINIQDSSIKEKGVKHSKENIVSGSGNVLNLLMNTPEIEFETHVVKEGIITQTNNKDDFFKETNKREIALSEISQNQESQLLEKNISCERNNEPVKTKKPELIHQLHGELNLSLKDVLQSNEEEINIQDSKIKEKLVKDSKYNIRSDNENVFNLLTHTPEIEFEAHLVKGVITKTNSTSDSFNETNVKETNNREIALSEILRKQESQLMKKGSSSQSENEPVTRNSPELIDHLCDEFNLSVTDALQSNEEKSMKAEKENTVISVDESVPYLKKYTEEKKFKPHMLTQEIVKCAPNKIDASKKIKIEHAMNGELVQSKISQSKLCWDLKNNMSSKENSENKLFQTIVFPLAIKNKINKVDDSVCNKTVKVPKNKVQPVNEGRVILTKQNDKNDKGSKKVVNQSHKNLIFKEGKPQEVSDRNEKEFHSLLQHCDSLVTSLEKLTTNFKKSITSLNDNQNSKCCIKDTSAKLRIPHSCNGYCSISTLHPCCCRKVCSCHMIHSTCIRSIPFRTMVKEQCECIIETKSCTTVCKPHIVIPVQNEDLLHILTSKISKLK